MPDLAGASPRTVVGLRSDLVRFAGLVAQVGLLALVIRQFQIESSAFLLLALLAFAGFGVHYFLPLAAKLPFFVLLSLSGIVMVMGATTGAVLIAMGLVLIGVCHLPFSRSARVLLLMVLGGGLAVLRSGSFTMPWSSALWPILGSMFMFRLMVYLYDLEHDKAPGSIWMTLGYFFILPNVCFPLFPVIDFKTFRRNHVDRPSPEIYQIGIHWMVRGVTHLILYRVVYYYWTLGPSDVATARDLAQYLVSNFLLYLRVSGQFHLVVGMLYLFGFKLPETNHLYCLSSSFTDFWRRINIYWKDFMMKVFYYPAYFRLRKLGETSSLVLATLLVFAVTWLLHSYQWFWLRSSFPIVWQDAAFWGILAALVVVNSLYEMKHGRTRSLRTTRPSSRTLVMTALKTIATFASIVALWSLWTADSFGRWLSLWAVFVSAGDLAVVLAAAVLFGTGAALVFVFGGAKPASPGAATWRNSFASIAVLLVLALAGLPQVYERLGPRSASLVASLRSGKLSRRDMAALERGYYEDLLQVNRFDNQLWEVYMQKPAGFLDIQGTALIRYTGDFAQRELAPSMVSADSFSTVSTNRLGMRDQDYDETPAPDVYRMSLLGASIGMGWGVEDGETYEALVEDKLNRELGGGAYRTYEILNQAVPGYYPLQQAVAVEKALAYRPRVILYEATGREFSRSVYYLSEVLSRRIEVPYPELRSIAQKAGVTPGLPQEEGEKLLSPLREELVSWLYRHIVATCRANEVLPVWVFVPQTYQGSWEEETPHAVALAEQNGFIVIDLSDIYQGRDREPLRLAEWDQHPNALGHALIAGGLYAGLRKNEIALGLLVDPKPHTSQ
jgi:D-alanyl-lipoteichoic acid acyltransferase DltB (MBOAT superfamily)